MDLKGKLYYTKINLLILKGLNSGLIRSFDDDFYKELNKSIFNTIPVDIDIRFLKPELGPGRCYDRSLKMFFAMDNSLLVRGSLDYFRISGDISDVNHGWVERDNYVYDPTWLKIFDKDYYYKIFNVENVRKCNIEEYCNIADTNKELYQNVKNTTRDSLRNGGPNRYMLATTIPIIREIASSNRDFMKALKSYLEEINYNEIEINEAKNKELKKY